MTRWFWMLAILVVGGVATAVAQPPAAEDRPGGPPDGGRRPRPAADEDHGRPVDKIAKELGVSPEKFREVFRSVRPARRGEAPTREQREANRKILAEGLGVSPERLDEVMDKYRPEGPNGPPEGRGPEGRGPEGRGPEGRGPEGRGPEGRGQEGRGQEGRGPEGRRPEGRGGDGRGPEARGPENRRPGGDQVASGRAPRGPRSSEDRGRPNGPPPHNSQRFVEHALEFDADRDGKLDRNELMKFADDMGRRRAEHENAGGPRRGPEGPTGPPEEEEDDY